MTIATVLMNLIDVAYTIVNFNQKMTISHNFFKICLNLKKVHNFDKIFHNLENKVDMTLTKKKTNKMYLF